MKAALYFDSAVGFGDWRLLLSTRATRDLREARRADATLFKMIVKKMKFVMRHLEYLKLRKSDCFFRELSNGNFSDDNHKRLNGSPSGIAIYEAKVTGDQRLVVNAFLSSGTHTLLILPAVSSRLCSRI